MLHNSIYNCFLAFKTKGVYRVYGICFCTLTASQRYGECVIKISINLYYLSSKLKGLSELTSCYFTLRYEHIASHILICSVHRGRRRGVTCGCTNKSLNLEHLC